MIDDVVERALVIALVAGFGIGTDHVRRLTLIRRVAVDSGVWRQDLVAVVVGLVLAREKDVGAAVSVIVNDGELVLFEIPR